MAKKVEQTTTTLSLIIPLTLASGEVLEALNVRMPLVKDFRLANQQAKNSVESELVVIARCCGLVLEDLDNLTWKDYQRLQTFFFGSEDRQGDTE